MKLSIKTEKEFKALPRLRWKLDPNDARGEDATIIAWATRRHKGDSLFFWSTGKLGLYYCRLTQKAATFRRKELIEKLSKAYGIDSLTKKRDWKLADFIISHGRFPKKGDRGFLTGATEEDHDNPTFQQLLKTECRIGDIDGILIFEPKVLSHIPSFFFRSKRNDTPRT